MVFIEILGAKIRQNKKIEGIQITPNVNKKSSQFADDLWAALKNTRSVQNLFKELDAFARVSGLKINYDKTQLMRIGSLRQAVPMLYMQKPISWSNRVQILGIVFSNNKDDMIQANYKPILDRIKLILSNWQNRSLSLIGKILVINTLVMSLLSHVFLCTYSPKEEFHLQVKKLIINFLWDNGKVKIKYDRLIKDYSEGGLKLIDSKFKNISLKCKWLKLVQEKNAAWSHYACKVLPLPIDDILCTNISPSMFYKQTSNHQSFWYEVWKAWAEYTYNPCINLSTVEIVNQPLWYNLHIVQQGKVMFEKKLSESNIRYIQDIMDLSKGVLYSFDQMQEIFNLRNSDFLKYYSTISAIPIKWKNKVSATSNVDPTLVRKDSEVLLKK